MLQVATGKERLPRVLHRATGTSKSIESVDRRPRRPSIRDARCRDWQYMWVWYYKDNISKVANRTYAGARYELCESAIDVASSIPGPVFTIFRNA